jgi:hypothetical protein
MAYQNQDRQDEAVKMFILGLEVGSGARPSARQSMQVWYYLQGAASAMGKKALGEACKAAFEAATGSQESYLVALKAAMAALD